MSEPVSERLVQTDPVTGLRKIYDFPDRRNHNAYYLRVELSPGAWSFSHHGITLSAAEQRERAELLERLNAELDKTAADFDAEHPDDDDE